MDGAHLGSEEDIGSRWRGSDICDCTKSLIGENFKILSLKHFVKFEIQVNQPFSATPWAPYSIHILVTALAFE